MRNILIASLAVCLLGCGAESDKSGSITSFDEAGCFNEVSITLDGDGQVTGNNEVYKVIGSGSQKLSVSGNGHAVCLASDIEELEVSGNGNQVFVLGVAAEVDVSGNDNKVYVFGAAGMVEMSGIDNTVYTNEVSGLNNSGIDNKIEKIN